MAAEGRSVAACGAEDRPRWQLPARRCGLCCKSNARRWAPLPRPRVGIAAATAVRRSLPLRAAARRGDLSDLDSEGEESGDLELLGVLALLGEAFGVFFGDATTGFAGDEASVGSAASRVLGGVAR